MSGQDPSLPKHPCLCQGGACAMGRVRKTSAVMSGRAHLCSHLPWGRCGSVPGVVLWNLGPLTTSLSPLRPGSAHPPNWATGGLWQTGSPGPWLAVGLALSSASGLSRRAQPSYASSPGLRCGRELYRFFAGTPNPSPRDLPGPRPGTGSFWAPTWHCVCGCASSLPPLLFSRGERCRPGPEEWRLLLQLLPPLRPPARRELLLPAWQPVHAGLLHFFYLLCFSCMGPSATWQQRAAPRTALLLACGAAEGCRVVPGASYGARSHGPSPLGTLSLPPGFCRSCFPESLL